MLSQVDLVQKCFLTNIAYDVQVQSLYNPDSSSLGVSKNRQIGEKWEVLLLRGVDEHQLLTGTSDCFVQIRSATAEHQYLTWNVRRNGFGELSSRPCLCRLDEGEMLSPSGVNDSRWIIKKHRKEIGVGFAYFIQAVESHTGTRFNLACEGTGLYLIEDGRKGMRPRAEQAWQFSCAADFNREFQKVVPFGPLEKLASDHTEQLALVKSEHAKEVKELRALVRKLEEKIDLRNAVGKLVHQGAVANPAPRSLADDEDLVLEIEVGDVDVGGTAEPVADKAVGVQVGIGCADVDVEHFNPNVEQLESKEMQAAAQEPEASAAQEPKTTRTPTRKRKRADVEDKDKEDEQEEGYRYELEKDSDHGSDDSLVYIETPDFHNDGFHPDVSRIVEITNLQKPVLLEEMNQMVEKISAAALGDVAWETSAKFNGQKRVSWTGSANNPIQTVAFDFSGGRPRDSRFLCSVILGEGTDIGLFKAEAAKDRKVRVNVLEIFQAGVSAVSANSNSASGSGSSDLYCLHLPQDELGLLTETLRKKFKLPTAKKCVPGSDPVQFYWEAGVSKARDGLEVIKAAQEILRCGQVKMANGEPDSERANFLGPFYDELWMKDDGETEDPFRERGQTFVFRVEDRGQELSVPNLLNMVTSLTYELKPFQIK